MGCVFSICQDSTPLLRLNDPDHSKGPYVRVYGHQHTMPSVKTYDPPAL